MSITPIDNLRALLDGGSGRWIPFSLDVGAIPGFSEPIRRKFREKTGAEDPAEYFRTDLRTFSLSARFGGDDPARLHGPVLPGTTFDEWGIGHRSAAVEGTVDKNYPPLGRATCVADVEALPSPIVEIAADTSAIEAWHEQGYAVFGYAGSIYEWSWWLRGMENFLMDLVDQPALAEAVVRKVEGYTTRLAVATARAGIDVLSFYDDAGMQRGMQIAPALWRQFIKPAWRRVLAAVRQAVPKARFFLHSCGRIDAILPDIIDVGFDVLHPVQPECMDFQAVHRQYGHQILLAATISAQKIFPFSSPDEVRREVRRLAEAIGPSRRAILMPSNVIQPETPWENVVAFAEEAARMKDEG
jgi:uroporphyrinogen decarboxylase